MRSRYLEEIEYQRKKYRRKRLKGDVRIKSRYKLWETEKHKNIKTWVYRAGGRIENPKIGSDRT